MLHILFYGETLVITRHRDKSNIVKIPRNIFFSKRNLRLYLQSGVSNLTPEGKLCLLFTTPSIEKYFKSERKKVKIPFLNAVFVNFCILTALKKVADLELKSYIEMLTSFLFCISNT